MSYSQNNEEEVILNFLNSTTVDLKNLLDIGAYVPDTFSNSRALIDQGWSAVLVEPSPAPFLALLKHYKNNPKVTLVNTAVAPTGKWLDFYDSGGDAVSSADPAHIARWTGTANFTKFSLKAVSVSELFLRFGTYFTFINLDVEGLNWEIFREIPWELMTRTRIICVEHNDRAYDMEMQIQRYGFKKLAQNAENIILARS